MIQMIVTVVLSLITTFILYPLILKFALRQKCVDIPNQRKQQEKPVPLLGGVSIFLGMYFALAVAIGFWHYTSLIPVLMMASLMLMVGLIDDMVDVPAMLRFIMEILLFTILITYTDAYVDNLYDLWHVGTFSQWIALPITVVACVGIVNAINMVDGVNGLAGGLCMMIGICAGVVLMLAGDVANAVLAFAMVAALVPFLIHNIFGDTSKMYLGDSGSLLLGTIVSWLVIQLMKTDFSSFLQNGGSLCNVALCVALLSIPVFDTLRVMVVRIAHGQSPMHADRNHLHHIIYDYGESHTLVTVIEILYNIIVILTWYGTYLLGASKQVQLYVVIALCVLLVCGTILFIKSNMRLNTMIAYRLRKRIIQAQEQGGSMWNRIQRLVDR